MPTKVKQNTSYGYGWNITRRCNLGKKEPFVKHHLDKYGKLPIWVAIEIWDFGLMSKLYAGMKLVDQKPIASKYGATGKQFKSWLRSLNLIRNIVAHHSRLWNINILERTPLLSGPDWQKLNNARPFYYFCLMKKLLDAICPNSTWGNRLIELTDRFPGIRCNAVALKDFGALENWKERSLWEKRKPAHTHD